MNIFLMNRNLIKIIGWLFLGFLVLTMSCQLSQTSAKIKQGIEGKVIWREGDFMPRIGERRENIVKPVSREIYIYEPTTLNELRGQAPFFMQPRTRRVAVVHSDENGKFQIALPEGVYSIFVREEKGLFANIFDKDGVICPVTVKSQTVTAVEIVIDYKASY